MHYSAYAFSMNGEPTIEPLNPMEEGVTMGQRVRLSDKDIQRINKMYNCPT